ncbi:MAG: hypothetical protein AAF799_30305 [Myxococcota bacterium]
MSPRLRAHSIAAAEPSLAAQQIATAALGDAPRARPLVLVVASWGAHPGLRPSPWVLDGVMQAIDDGTLNGHSFVLGDDEGPDSLSARLSARGLPPSPARGADTITLHPAGSRRTLRIPRAWVGANLCLVLPCLHREQPAKQGPRWRGPVGQALLQLVSEWGAVRARDSIQQAAHCIAELFAHVSVIIDASWWAPLSADDEGAPFLLAPERTLGLRLTAPVSSDVAIDPQLADAWIGRQLGLNLRRRGEPPRVVGPAARTPWPKLPRSPAPRRKPGLAGQAVAALWQRTDAKGSRRGALPPAVPGSLAELWDDYESGSRPQ